jgi:hypothetical protein
MGFAVKKTSFVAQASMAIPNAVHQRKAVVKMMMELLIAADMEKAPSGKNNS